MSIKQRKEKGVLAVPVALAAGSVASAMAAKICAKHFVELKEEDAAMAATAAAGSS